MLPRRELGRTGEKLSVVGFGGILVTRETPETAARLVAEAVAAGVNYFDVAPTYGNAEERLGPALAPYRDQAFLACKTTQRSRDGAALELRQSLGKLQCDHFDLYQLHALTTPEDVQQAFAPGGAMEALREAKALGLVRYLGFSAHSEAAALQALELYPFDSVLFPINYFAATQHGFGTQLLAAAAERGVGRLALKTMALGRLAKDEAKAYGKCWYAPLDRPELVRAALRWTLSQRVTAALTPGEEPLFKLALAAAADLAPPEPAELAQLAAQLNGRKPIFPE